MICLWTRLILFFLCVNNHKETIDISPIHKCTTNGSHWSLLLMDKNKKCFFHYDSIKNNNQMHAKEIAIHINKRYGFKEVHTIQQIDSFSCGLHVMVKAKQIVDDLLKQPKQTIFLNKTNLHNKPIFNKSLHTEVNKLNQCGHDDVSNSDTCLMPSNLSLESQGNQITNIMNEDDYFTPVLSKKRNSKKTLKNRKTRLIEKPVSVTYCKNRFSAFDTTNDHKESDYTKEKQNTQDKLSNDCKKHSEKQSTSNEDNYNSKNECTQITSLKRKKNLVLISDSHGRTLSERLNNTNSNTLRATGLVKPNANIINVLKNHETFTKSLTKDDYLVVIGGTNDLNCVGCESIITEEIENLLEKTNTTNIIISSIPFRYDIPYVNKKIKKININLKRITEKYSHSSFLSFNNMNRSDYSYHGVHFNNKGKSKLTHLISDFINHKQKIPVIITNRLTKKNRTQTFHKSVYQDDYFLGLNPVQKNSY